MPLSVTEATPPLLSTLSLLAALHKERGAALLEGADGAASPAFFAEHAAQTYAALSAAQKDNPDFWAVLPERFFEAFAQRTNASFRAGMGHRAMTEWYVFNLEQPVHQLALSLLTNDSEMTPSQIGAFVHAITALGFLGHLRDNGLSVYAHGELLAVDAGRMRHSALSCLSRERLFLGLAEERLRRWMDEARAPSATTVGHMDQTLRRIRDGAAKSVLAEMTRLAWLSLFNEEITLRHEALEKTLARLWADTKSAMPSSMSLESDVEQRLEVLGALPLFRGLSEGALRATLRGAKIIEKEKNVVVFSQGDRIDRFYIVLEGWARSVKTSDDGREAIVQLLGRRDALFDQGLFDASLASLSLKTVTRCTFLALSLGVLTEQLSRGAMLSTTFLTAALSRLQRFVGHFEQISLRSAEQRVGWFLVNLYLETGLEGEPLKLPFDKTTIASFLNIKPETLSRVLKGFKEKGFTIEGQKIALPHPQALCDYCDPEMTRRCCRAEAVQCAPLRALWSREGKRKKDDGKGF